TDSTGISSNTGYPGHATPTVNPYSQKRCSEIWLSSAQNSTTYESCVVHFLKTEKIDWQSVQMVAIDASCGPSALAHHAINRRVRNTFSDLQNGSVDSSNLLLAMASLMSIIAMRNLVLQRH